MVARLDKGTLHPRGQFLPLSPSAGERGFAMSQVHPDAESPSQEAVIPGLAAQGGSVSEGTEFESLSKERTVLGKGQRACWTRSQVMRLFWPHLTASVSGT